MGKLYHQPANSPFHRHLYSSALQYNSMWTRGNFGQFCHLCRKFPRIRVQFHYNANVKYCKIPIISPGLIFVQKALLLGLFSGELIFRGAYYWKEFCVWKWVGLDNKNSLKHYENSLRQRETATTNSPWAYIRGTWREKKNRRSLRINFSAFSYRFMTFYRDICTS